MRLAPPRSSTRRDDSLEKTDAGRDWGQEEKGTTEDGIAASMDVSLSELREMVMDRESWRAARFTGSQRVGHD